MNVRFSAVISFALLLLLTLTGAAQAVTTTMTVKHTGSGTNIFNSIQAAIETVHSLRIGGSTDTFEIKVEASSTSYSGFTMKDPISIYGERTGGTFINGGNPQITVSGIASGAEIRNFTFLSSGTAIAVSNSSAVRITNNVFLTGTGNTAITVSNSPSSSIVNNTFYRNNVAISTDTNLVITNNIFSLNTKAIATSATTGNISYNDYNPGSSAGVTLDINSIPNTTNHTDPDPKFVDPDNSDATKKDFHLQPGSPCIGTGNPLYLNPGSSASDMGAYGGPKADVTIATITGVTATVTSDATSSSIAVSWNPSTTVGVTAYRVYYTSTDDSAALATPASPVEVLFGTNSTTITVPRTGPTAPSGTTSITGITPLNQGLLVSWSQAAGATGYHVKYGPTGTPLTNTITVDGATTLSTTITGLANLTTYDVAVVPVAETKFSVSVTAVVDRAISSNPGGSNESPKSTPATAQIGSTIEGSQSAVVPAMPEATTPTPNLKNEGCFIATAAFGFYSAPQVQALRDFRDRFLMTNAPGRAFVAWYYHYGPIGAHFINTHPWLKAPVRVALFPLIVMSLVLTGGSLAAKLAVLFLVTALSALIWRRKNLQLRNAAVASVLLAALACLVAPVPAQAETRPDRPHWSLELKGGESFPSRSNFFGGNQAEYGAALAYKLHRTVEVGLEASYLRGTGNGRLLANNLESSEQVTYERVPLDLFVLGRLVLNEDQLLVPYAGVGYTRLFYRENAPGVTVKGSVNGFHARGGVQILLDGLERDASLSLYKEFGIHHTYLFVEGKYLDARADTSDGGSVNAGGTSVLGGLLFEF
ncbi:hypothetical protein GMST_21610 [Geomonas silvestris]|uniref:Fibronectin type-III domain-containing protein n=1 Tax=Geomonas silvestris TaxID=2740184 RepID=A0A6V8MIQ1_9BACT|nr:MXAN_2562 family outer membrane beta-barrel protein [Geomonas silvestris]GFO59836.1 hypothetical protein GMST_21610 [Geomonas silvestris]